MLALLLIIVVEECVSTGMPRLLFQKEAAKLSSAIMKSFAKKELRPNLRILAVFECDPQIKSYVPIVETIFMTLVGTFVGRENTGEHNPQACYDLYDRVRSRARMPDIDGYGLNGALSIHQGVIGVFQRATNLILHHMQAGATAKHKSSGP